jgi:hypothetical protein
MTYVERILGEQGQANRRLGEEILQQMSLEAMHAAADQSRRSTNVYGSTCPWCCGDVDAAVFKTGVAGCQFCSNSEPAAELSRSRWISLEMASRYGQGQAQRARE